MRYIRQHIKVIIEKYKGDLPLTHFLKNYYKQYPKLGSRDRKILSEMSYSWYRCEKGIEDKSLSFEDKINACLFLCSNQAQLIQSFLPDAWEPEEEKHISERIELLREHNIYFDLKQLFPYNLPLSENINKADWLLSMLSQPRLFIRIRKQKKEILALLEQKQIPYHFIGDACLSLPNGAAIDKLLPEDTYVVQDASSQKTGDYFQAAKNEQWYDCCCGAGGKSLLLKDIEPTVKLSVSDTRDSILHNLQKRFSLYKRSQPQSYKMDVSQKGQLLRYLGAKTFSGIICDVPCTGSGTWARTPEQMFFFEPIELQQITSLQKSIAINMAPYLQKNGRLIYITCSVFRQENEDVVKEVIQKTGLQLQEMKLINGISQEADTMFVAVLRKG